MLLSIYNSTGTLNGSRPWLLDPFFTISRNYWHSIYTRINWTNIRLLFFRHALFIAIYSDLLTKIELGLALIILRMTWIHCTKRLLWSKIHLWLLFRRYWIQILIAEFLNFINALLVSINFLNFLILLVILSTTIVRLR